MRTEYTEETHYVQRSGYVRGTQEVTVYFDKLTGKYVDYECIGEMEIMRDDTEIDTYDLPTKSKGNS